IGDSHKAGEIRVAEAMIRLRILKGWLVTSSKSLDRGRRGYDPFEDAESELIHEDAICTNRVAEAMIRLRILIVLGGLGAWFAGLCRRGNDPFEDTESGESRAPEDTIDNGRRGNEACEDT